MNNQIIARVVRSGGGAWDKIPFADGKGTILRPHPDAGGGAHPRYMEQGDGFLSVSPSFGPMRLEEEILGDGKIVLLEWRETKKGEKFVAVLPAGEKTATHLLVLANWSPTSESPIDLVYCGSDHTASSASDSVEAAFLVGLGAEVWNGDTALTATPEGLKEGVALRIGAADLEVLA